MNFTVPSPNRKYYMLKRKIEVDICPHEHQKRLMHVWFQCNYITYVLPSNLVQCLTEEFLRDCVILRVTTKGSWEIMAAATANYYEKFK